MGILILREGKSPNLGQKRWGNGWRLSTIRLEGEMLKTSIGMLTAAQTLRIP